MSEWARVWIDLAWGMYKQTKLRIIGGHRPVFWNHLITTKHAGAKCLHWHTNWFFVRFAETITGAVISFGLTFKQRTGHTIVLTVFVEKNILLLSIVCLSGGEDNEPNLGCSKREVIKWTKSVKGYILCTNKSNGLFRHQCCLWRMKR